jgi:hypothetical protein
VGKRISSFGFYVDGDVFVKEFGGNYFKKHFLAKFC